MRNTAVTFKRLRLNMRIFLKCKFIVCLFWDENSPSFMQNRWSRIQKCKNAYFCWGANRCLLQNLTTLEEALQTLLQSEITAKTERNYNQEQNKEDVDVHREPSTEHEHAVQYWTLGTCPNTGYQTSVLDWTIQVWYTYLATFCSVNG